MPVGFAPKQKLVALQLPVLHPRQREFVMDPHRIVVASCGTKFGKTLGLSAACVLEAWNHPGRLVWWCAPTYKQAAIAIDYISRMLPPRRYQLNKQAMSVSLIRADGREHSRIEFRSADNPDSLRGAGVHMAVIDECAYVSHPAFVSVWTTLTQTRGKLRMISTPKGKGSWFYQEWVKGWFPDENQKHPEYHSYKLPTYANPHVPRESIEEFRRNMPADVFRQEVEAEWLEDGAGVFRGVRACQTGRWLDQPDPKALYVMGIDFAKLADYTVFVIADYNTKEVVHIDRFTGQDWNVTTQQAINTARRWNNARILADATGVGDVPVDSIKAVYPHCDGYVIGNNQAKVALIQKLQFAIENGEIKFPAPRLHENAAVLDHELGIYGYQMSSTGKFLFSAPEGAHDDTVIATALANWLLSQEQLVYRARSVRGI